MMCGAIAAPIWKDNAVIAAVSIAMPSYRFTDSNRQLCE